MTGQLLQFTKIQPNLPPQNRMTGFKIVSLLQFTKGRTVKLFTDEQATILGWRRASWGGLALSLLVNDQVTHGWAPETIVKILENHDPL